MIEVETLAVEAGILLAREMELPHIINESDAMSVVQTINTGELEGCLGHLYQGIFYLLSSFSSWKAMHVKREYNRVAHELAQSARRWKESQVWKGVSPPFVHHLIQNDCIQLCVL